MDLSDCRLFRGLSGEEIQRLCACLGATRRRCRKGEAVWRTGDAVSGCAVVLAGRVRAESVTATGRRRVAAQHGPGALFGDVLMASADRRSLVDVIAAEDTQLLLLPYAGMMGGCSRACAAHERLRQNLAEELADKYWALRRRVLILTQRSLRARIAARLLDAAGGGTEPFSLHGRREELADELGVNRSALSRELSRMRAQGLLDFYRDSFRLLDIPGLEACLA